MASIHDRMIDLWRSPRPRAAPFPRWQLRASPRFCSTSGPDFQSLVRESPAFFQLALQSSRNLRSMVGARGLELGPMLWRAVCQCDWWLGIDRVSERHSPRAPGEEEEEGEEWKKERGQGDGDGMNFFCIPCIKHVWSDAIQ